MLWIETEQNHCIGNIFLEILIVDPQRTGMLANMSIT